MAIFSFQAIKRWPTLLQICFLLSLINSATGALTWVKPPRSLAVFENTPQGTVVGNLTLQGVGVLNIASQCSHLVIQQKDKTSSSLLVNLVLNTQLDKENPPPGLICNLAGSSDTDTPSPVPLTVQIVILDVNDVTPRLLNQPYSVSVSESEKPNTVVFQNISAVDEDTNDRQTYTLTAKASDGKFKINPTNGQITLQSLLDFEDVRFYQYVVTVTDDFGHKASADVFITVLDEQDTPPFFTGEPFQKVIYENDKQGTTLVTVKADDGDKGKPNAILLSVVNDSCGNIFSIDNATGAITLREVVDRDSGVILTNVGVCSIIILATEDNTYPQQPGRVYTATTSVTISILDVNDNPPLFSDSSYTIKIDENTPNGSPINLNTPIRITDIDQGDNAAFDVKVTMLDKYFDVAPSHAQSTGDILIRVTDSTVLDYEKNQTLVMELQTRDRSGRFTETATVTISINNLNDNSPKFKQPKYQGQVPEHSAAGTEVTTVTATDDDSNMDGKGLGTVKYLLDGTDPSFGMNSSTGQVFAISSNLDREIQNLYYLTVIAQDGGNNKATVLLEIRVTDINDQAPVFNTVEYVTSLRESETQLMQPITVHATDNDEPNTNNSQVTYAILRSDPNSLESNFSLNPMTGELSVTSGLDYEKILFKSGQDGEITLYIKAQDHGYPSNTVTGSIIIMLQDVNDNDPECGMANYVDSIPENTIATIINITATDKDGSAPNNIIMYSLDQVNAGKFFINSSTGVLSTREKLDREIQDLYIITVTVVDLGVPSRSGTCQVTISVTDINDEQPVFTQKTQTVTWPENKLGMSISNDATDKDQNPFLAFDIDWDSCEAFDPAGQPVSTTSLKKWIDINPTTGEITSLQEFDREIVARYTIPVMVNDFNSQNGVQVDKATLTLVVEDVNDNPPTFPNSNLAASIQENMPKGSEVKTALPLIITDMDTGNNSIYTVMLKDVSTFNVSPSNGTGNTEFKIVVINATAVDYELHESFNITVVAVDVTNSSLRNEAVIVINITNENDKIPEFVGAPYRANVSENSPLYTTVFSCTAKDDDKGEYGILTFSLQDPTSTFNISSTSGAILQVKQLDRETTSDYTLLVTATDKGNFRATTQLVITVTDENDNKPVFTQSTYTLNISEETRIISPEFYIKATDNDAPNTVNSQIEYTISNQQTGSPQSQLKLELNTGKLTVVRALDREGLSLRTNGTFVLEVQAKDKGIPHFESNTTVEVNVIDINDNNPIFSLDSYVANISEDSKPGTIVTTITATDEDVSFAFNQVTYQLDALSSKVFSIDNKTGIIRIIGKLDREQTSEYSLMVTAVDNGSPALINTTLVIVTVTDVNDSPPVLSWDYMTQTITENKNFSGNITATDPDENTDLIFSINWSESTGLNGSGAYLSGDPLKKFVTINSKTGEISSNGSLDREELQRLQLTIVVTDLNNVPGSKNSDTATLTLIVEDVNDNHPRFPSENLMATIQENMPAGSEVKMNSTLTISDFDIGDNSMYTIQLDDSSVFDVSPNQGKGSTNLFITVHNASLLDYELHKSFIITVIAKEDRTIEKFSATCTIIINVENINDNFPKFNKSADDVYLKEDAIKGRYITTIYAHDADEAPYGTVYYLIDEKDTGFAVNNISGDVTLDLEKVDREVKDSYIVMMKARDVDGFEGSMQLIVKLLDVNDQCPQFKAISHTAEVKENESMFQQKVFVQAVDADEPGTNNSKVFYRITKTPPEVNGSIFEIGEETGEITLSAKAPDYERLVGQFQRSILTLEVTAIDRGVPPLNSSVVVNVTLLDTNDVQPLFDSQSYSASVIENSAEGVKVTTVTAVDKDGTSPNNDLYYAILSGSRDKLQVNSSTGEIKVGVGASLDREGSEKDGFILTVLAIDKGNPALTGSTTVTVTLADINDCPPEFLLSTSSHSIYENASVGTEITRLNATDKDEDSVLNYSISWNDCHAIDERGKSANASLIQQWLTISNNGTITVLSEMDRETAEELILRVVVTDVNGTENMPQTATATITISILDVNDNDPMIEQLTGDRLYLNVSEGTKVNSEVTTLQATDRDKGQTVTFSLDKSESHFTVSPTGKLSLTRALDRETEPRLQFNITATDSGSPPRSSVMAVWVEVLDINDKDPVFINNKTTFTVLENSDNTTLVGSVTAQDSDLGDNGNVTYEFKDIGPFRINQLTGDFYVSEELDREAKSSYTLTVFAMDNPELESRRRAPLVITVLVDDVNDHAPEFPAAVMDKGYEGKLSEKAEIGTSLKILPSDILANDADAGNNSLVTYSLLDSVEFDFFMINPISGEVTVQNNLKNYSGNYSYVVNASDHGMPALWNVVNLTITVLDENINAPVFVQQGPVPNIPECAVAGKSVYTFSAADADRDKNTNGKVQYFLDNVGIGNNYSQLFYLNPDTGELFTSSSNKANTFDKEKLSNFYIQVQAKDNGIPSNIISTGPLLITITDINDSPPVFDPIPDTNLTVEEGFLGTVGIVKATDADEGSQLTYTIDDIDDSWKNGYFDILSDPMLGGVITTLKPLDRELVAQIRMKVVAKDMAAVITDILCDNMTSTLDQRSAPLDILVNVEDINDNPPRFHENSLTKGFLSSTNFGERIINLQDHVQDEDREAGHRIHQFHQLGDLVGDKDITSTWTQSGKLAEIQPIRVDRNGTVSTNYKFPEDAFGFFTLRVLANDTAGNDTVDLKIYIVGDQQVIHLTVWHSEDELRTLQHILTSELSSVGYLLVPDNILPAYTEDGRLDSSKAVLVAHAVDSRGSIVEGKSLLNKIDTYPQKQDIINRYQILKTQTAEEAKQVPAAQTEERIKDILYGIIAVIAITFIITLYVLIYNIRRFKRKLKAATLEVQGLDPLHQKIIPGVDNSNMQKSNPLFMVNNLVLDDNQFPAGQEEEHSDSVSIASNSSLDKNALNSENVPWKSPSALDEQELTLDLYDTEAPNPGLYPRLPKYPDDDFTSHHRPHTSQEDSDSLDSLHMTLSHFETTDI